MLQKASIFKHLSVFLITHDREETRRKKKGRDKRKEREEKDKKGKRETKKKSIRTLLLGCLGGSVS